MSSKDLIYRGAVAPTRPPPWRYVIAAALAGGFVLAVGLVEALRAPDVHETCATVLELAEQAGEMTDDRDRELCERRFAQLRRERGLFGWAKLARCVDRAATIPEAGGC